MQYMYDVYPACLARRTAAALLTAVAYITFNSTLQRFNHHMIDRVHVGLILFVDDTIGSQESVW